MKATLNFANINHEALTILSNCQLAINVLAEAERELKNMREALKSNGETKEEIKEHTAEERRNVASAKERANTMCTSFITRYVSTEDFCAGEMYHFDMVAFLQNIGVLSDGEDTAKTAKKVKNITSLVIDRYKTSITRRKAGDNALTFGETKEVKNTAIELVLAFIYAMVDSGAVEYCGGGLALVSFDK
jgi:ribose 5-phosphate isomerase RpiB